MIYDAVFGILYNIAHFDLLGILVCRFAAPLVLAFLLWLSRMTGSHHLKVFSFLISIVLYFFPSIVDMYLAK